VFADAPDFAFIIFNNVFKKVFSHLTNFTEKVKIHLFTGFLSGEMEMLFNGDEIHNANA